MFVNNPLSKKLQEKNIQNNNLPLGYYFSCHHSLCVVYKICIIKQLGSGTAVDSNNKSKYMYLNIWYN